LRDTAESDLDQVVKRLGKGNKKKGEGVNMTLGEIIQEHGGLIQTGPFGSQLHQYDYTKEGIPVVMPKDIRDGRICEVGVARVPEAKASQLSRHYLKAGSVVFPRRGEISKCAYIDEEQEGFLCGTGCIKIEPPEEILRSKFLYYHLGLRHSIDWLERNAVGTTRGYQIFCVNSQPLSF